MPDSSLNRRTTDCLKNSTDHDLLIKHSVKIDHLCKLTKGVQDSLDKYSGKIEDRCESRMEFFNAKIDHGYEEAVDQTTFRWVIGILIFAMVSMVAVIGVNQVLNSKNEARIISNQEHIIELEKSKKEVEKRIKELHPILTRK